MAFFGSKSYERELKRSYSSDRFRRERDRTTSTSTTNTTTTHSHKQHQKLVKPAPAQLGSAAMPSADEFGVVVPGEKSNKKGKDDPPSLTFSTTSTSTSLPSLNDPITPVVSPSLSIPVSVVNGTTKSSPSSSTTSLNKRPSTSSTRQRTVSAGAGGSGSTSKHSSSHSSNPTASRRRTPQLEVDDASSSDAIATRVRKHSTGSRSSELKAERQHQQQSGVVVSKSRSKTSLRAAQSSSNVNPSDGGGGSAAEAGSSENIPARPPRSVRPPDMQPGSSTSRTTPPSSAKDATATAATSPSSSQPQTSNQKPGNSPASRSISSSPSTTSPSPFAGPSNTGLPLRQDASSSLSGPAVVTLRREDSSLSVPPSSHNNNTNNKKSTSGGNASDSSYGAPFSDFGVGGHGFSVKRLLSKPAASSPSISGGGGGGSTGGGGGGGVRSEPDTTSTTDSYDSYGAYALAARRRRVEGRSTATDTPSSVYSLTGGSVSASSRDQLYHTGSSSRRPATSDTEPLQRGFGSLGRARGLEWGHVLSREREREREREKERERERGKHVREGSSYSLSSPSEGAAASYPYGIALERERERRAGNNTSTNQNNKVTTRPVIQLTTSAVRRLSALGAKDSGSSERDRSHSPATPMTFGQAPSPTPSPLTTSSSRAASAIPSPAVAAVRTGSRTSSSQPSPSPSSIGAHLHSSVVRRAESPRPPVGLTPAEIVAHQYKEQERRRAEFEREAAREAEVPERLHHSRSLTARTSAMSTGVSFMEAREALRDKSGVYEVDYERSQRTVRVKQQEKEREREREREKERERERAREKEKEREKDKPLFRHASTLGLPSPTSPTPSTGNKSDGGANDGSQASHKGEPPTPYYTVFGEPSGRVVNIGSARDSAFGLFDRAAETRAKATEKAVVAELSGAGTAGNAITVTTTTTTTTSSSAIGFSEVVATGGGGGGEKPAKSAVLRRKLSRKMSGRVKADGSFARGGGGGGGANGSGRESGKESSSDGKENDRLEFGELLATGFGLGGGFSSGEEWFSATGTGSNTNPAGGATFGTEGVLRARPSLTLNMNTTSNSTSMSHLTSTSASAAAVAAGRQSATLPREKGGVGGLASVKMSMDSYVAVQSIESTSGRTLPSAANGVPGGFVVGKARLKDEKEREREKEKGKLWGLVKRISSNTLKDKYKRTSTDMVPPVPALPASSSTHTSPITLDDARSTKLGDIDEFAIQLGTPPSSHPPSRRPSTAPAFDLGDSPKDGRFATLKRNPSASLAHQMQQQHAALLGTSPTHHARPSVTTRSSSPMSSDLVFSYKQSDVSSVTSYGCEFISPTNSKLSRGHPVLGEHILPPETLSMFDELNLNFDLRKEDEGRSTKLDTYRNVGSDGYDGLFYAEEPTCHQALPVPPRRPGAAKADSDMPDEFRSESPTIPSFSADNVINAFNIRKRATGAVAASAFTGSDFGTVTGRPSPPSSGSPASSVMGGGADPPPRPPRSALRIPPGGSSSNSGHSPPPSLACAVFEDQRGRTSIGSHSQASTARPTPSISHSSASGHTGAHGNVDSKPSTTLLRSTSSPCSTPSPPPPPELLDSHQSPVSASDSASSTMTFRDITAVGASSSSSAKPALTEKEKIDKWNDLLDRSERAGGTLHVGFGDVLLSDQMRESAYEYEPTIRDSLYDY